ncbi:MAG: DUF4398 domain-containing protein [Spirochaetes bacterium]|nr:DUF4398 domain-containing protein [Spirochaetota bacterium]MBX3721390.1 DUF4398 domain-containing protein [Turneriella sp.]
MLSLVQTKKTILALTAGVLLIAVGCGDPIPMEEMGIAKVAIARAETVKSAKYSPKNFEDAQKTLLAAHDFVEKGKMSDAKEKAIEAKKQADAAYDESAPKLAQDTRGEAEAAIRAAEESNAEQFATDELAASKASLVQGDKYYESKDYLSSYHLFEESREKAKRALTTSEAQVEVMKRELGEVDETIAAAERSGAEQSAPDTLKKAKTDAGNARGDLANKKLKSAYTNLQAAKASSKEALGIAQKESAKSKLAKAEKDVAAAEAKLTDLKGRASDPQTQKALEASEEAQQSLKTADDNLTAAKEALKAAREADKNQAYAEVATQSDEASRLAKILSDSLPETEVLLAQAKDRAGIETKPVKEGGEKEGKEGVDEEGDKAGWKTYKVRYIPENRDCLWKIAGYKKIYNNARLWPKIYRANKGKIKNPDLIYPGQVFKIPPKKTKGE